MKTINRLKNCINYVIAKYPFFANFLIKLELIEDETIETACTNGKILKFNPAFIQSLKRQELIFLVLHEISHLILKHHLREGSRDHQIFNKAGDFAANSFLKSYGIELLQDCLYDAKYENLNAEKIYSIIYEQEKNKQENGEGNKGDKFGDFEQDKSKNENDIEQAENEIDQEIIRACQVGKLAGDENGFIKKFAEQLKTSKENWMEKLLNYFDSFDKNDYSWTVCNSRYLSSGFYLPGLKNKVIKNIACFVDASGSIDLDLFSTFISQLKQIANDLETKIDLFLFYISIYQEIFDYQDQEILISGGGTSYKNVSEKIGNSFENYSVNLIFTDGYCNTFGDNQDNVLWIVYGNSSFNPPYGETIFINDNN